MCSIRILPQHDVMFDKDKLVVMTLGRLHMNGVRVDSCVWSHFKLPGNKDCLDRWSPWFHLVVTKNIFESKFTQKWCGPRTVTYHACVKLMSSLA